MFVNIWQIHGWDVTIVSWIIMFQIIIAGNTENVPRVRFTLTLERRPLYYLLNIIIPTVVGILAVLSALTFMVPMNSGERLSLGTSILLALSVFMLILQDNTPQGETPLLGTYVEISMYRKISNIRRTKFQNSTASRIVLQLSLPNPLKSCVKSLSREWRCSWSSADRRCSNYIWVNNNYIAYHGAPCIRGLTVMVGLKCCILSTICIMLIISSRDHISVLTKTTLTSTNDRLKSV